MINYIVFLIDYDFVNILKKYYYFDNLKKKILSGEIENYYNIELFFCICKSIL